MQKTARSDRLPLDAMTLCCRFTNVLDAKEVTVRPEVGIFAHGLFSEGAAWKTRKGEEEGCLVDPSLKELHPIMPVCQVRAIHQTKMSWDHMYHCPVFVVSTRGPTYLFCSNARIDAEDTEDKWILAGAAFLLSDD